MLVIKKSAVPKLAKLKVHAGIRHAFVPGHDWAADWYSYYAFASYVWAWNFPSKLLPRLTVECMGAGAPADGCDRLSPDLRAPPRRLVDLLDLLRSPPAGCCTRRASTPSSTRRSSSTASSTTSASTVNLACNLAHLDLSRP